MADGIIMLIPERRNKFEEFMALSLANGRPEAHLSLRAPTQSTVLNAGSSILNGRREINVKAIPYVTDGNWHSIQLIRLV